MKSKTVPPAPLAALVILAASLIFLGARERPRPEASWDARFLPEADNYGVRFRHERAGPPEPLNAARAREIPGRTAQGDPSPRAGIAVDGLNLTRTPPPVYGATGPALAATAPVRFPDGGEIRLKLIFGLNGESPSFRSRGNAFDWAVTPDGRHAPEAAAKDLLRRAPPPAGGDRPVHALRCLFATSGNVRILSASVADADSGFAGRPSYGFSRMGDETWVDAGLMRWTPGARELILTVGGGPMQATELPKKPGEQITLNGTPIRLLGNFPDFKGFDAFPREDDDPNSGALVLHDDGNGWNARLTLLQFPRNACVAAFRVKGDPEGDSFRSGTPMFAHPSGLVCVRPDAAKLKAGLTLEAFSIVRRVRLRLPDFPSMPAPAGAEDPLDWEFPKNRERADASVYDALRSIADIRKVQCLTGNHNILINKKLARPLSDFAGRNTLRAVLAATYAEELEKGMILRFDKRRRVMILEAPEPGRYERLGQWLRRESDRIRTRLGI